MGSVRGDGGCCKWIERSLLMSIVSCPLLMSIVSWLCCLCKENNTCIQYRNHNLINEKRIKPSQLSFKYLAVSYFF